MGLFTVETGKKQKFRNILKEIIDISAHTQINVFQFCDKDINYDRKYSVYKVTVDDRTYVLKRTDKEEADIYEKYLKASELPVPQYYGSFYDGKNYWILIEFICGNDIRDFKEEYAHECAVSVTQIMNRYWVQHDRTDSRYIRYMDRITKRCECLDNEPILERTYRIFIDRQRDCPLTLSNGDFLQFNGISRNSQIILIDWGFGGIMPYALDIARLIAHGTEDKITFPFYMTDSYRAKYVDEVYRLMNNPPDREQYNRDISLAVLNEYIEMIERELGDSTLERDRTFEYYYEHAHILAREILRNM